MSYITPQLLLLLIFFIICFIIIFISNKTEFKNKEFFQQSTMNPMNPMNSMNPMNPMNPNLFNDYRYEKDRTQLYGSLFLDKLQQQIKQLTDPQILYDTKRIDIIKFSDVLI